MAFSDLEKRKHKHFLEKRCTGAHANIFKNPLEHPYLLLSPLCILFDFIYFILYGVSCIVSSVQLKIV